jgi:hypothetical protein
LRFSLGESGITTATADVITDWKAATETEFMGFSGLVGDLIDMTIAGTASNYGEAATEAPTIEAAAAQAESLFTSTSTRHVYLYNKGATDTSYLLSDLDNNGTFETGVIFEGRGSAGSMDYWHIV